MIFQGKGKPTERNAASAPHWCRYVVLKKTMRTLASEQTWFERCRCGRSVSVVVDRNHSIGARKNPAVYKTWYDAEGNELKMTGNIPNVDKSQ